MTHYRKIEKQMAFNQRELNSIDAEKDRAWAISKLAELKQSAGSQIVKPS